MPREKSTLPRPMPKSIPAEQYSSNELTTFLDLDPPLGLSDGLDRSSALWGRCVSGALHHGRMTAFEIINSVGSSLGAVAAVGTAAFAWWGIHRTSSDSREKAQPFMTAEFALAENSDETVQLIVKNLGATQARDVAVTFDPPIPSGDPDSAAWTLRERYDAPISVIAPGQRFASSWWMNDYTLENPSSRNIHELSNQVKVTISYSGIDGTQLKDEFTLNAWLVLLEGQPVSSDSTLGSLRKIAKASQKNAAETANLAETVEALRFDERDRRSTD